MTVAAVSIALSDDDVVRIAVAVAEQLRRPADRLVTPQQASALTGISIKGLERRRSRALAPRSVKRGGRVFYLASELDRYIAENR